MGMPIDKAGLLALFLETLLYGVFFALFWPTLWTLMQDSARQTQRRRLVPLAIVMMAIATAHLIIDFVRVLQAFVTEDGHTIDAIAYYSNISNGLRVANSLLYLIQTLIGDGVVVWRCYILYNQKIFILIIFGLFMLVNVGAGVVICWSFFHRPPGSTIFDTAYPWITTFFVLTMTTNIFCTTAIALRIYRGRSPHSSQVSLTPVLLAVVESGALYATSLLGLMIAYVAGSNGQYAALDLVTPLVGITFCLIILQIQLHLTSNSSTIPISDLHIRQLSRMLRSNKGCNTELHVTGEEDQMSAYPVQPLAVDVKLDRQTDQHCNAPRDGTPSSSSESASGTMT